MPSVISRPKERRIVARRHEGSPRQPRHSSRPQKEHPHTRTATHARLEIPVCETSAFRGHPPQLCVMHCVCLTHAATKDGCRGSTARPARYGHPGRGDWCSECVFGTYIKKSPPSLGLEVVPNEFCPPLLLLLLLLLPAVVVA